MIMRRPFGRCPAWLRPSPNQRAIVVDTCGNRCAAPLCAACHDRIAAVPPGQRSCGAGSATGRVRLRWCSRDRLTRRGPARRTVDACHERRMARRAQGRAPGDWPAFLSEHSGLPGPRANLALVDAVAALASQATIDALLESGDEYLVMCAAAALGWRGDDPAAAARARALASDERWRVREGVAIGLLLGDRDLPALLVLAQGGQTTPTRSSGVPPSPPSASHDCSATPRRRPPRSLCASA